MRRRRLIATVLCFIPFSAFAQSVRQVPTPAVSDALQTTDLGLGKTVAWDSATPANKTELLTTNGIACNSATRVFTIKDEIGTAGTYPITVTPQINDKIDGAGTFILNSNFESITLQCDGASNWLVE